MQDIIIVKANSVTVLVILCQLKDLRRYVSAGFPLCCYLNVKGKEC